MYKSFERVYKKRTVRKAQAGEKHGTIPSKVTAKQMALDSIASEDEEAFGGDEYISEDFASSDRDSDSLSKSLHFFFYPIPRNYIKNSCMLYHYGTEFILGS